MGDAVIAAFFATDKPKAREKKRAEVESWLGGSPVAMGQARRAWPRPLKQGAHPLRRFIGRSSFRRCLRGEWRLRCDRWKSAVSRREKISDVLGEYTSLIWLVIRMTALEKCDLVAYFFRRLFALVRHMDALGCRAPTRLHRAIRAKAELSIICPWRAILRAPSSRLPWPGEAAVVVSCSMSQSDTPTTGLVLEWASGWSIFQCLSSRICSRLMTPACVWRTNAKYLS